MAFIVFTSMFGPVEYPGKDKFPLAEPFKLTGYCYDTDWKSWSTVVAAISKNVKTYGKKINRWEPVNKSKLPLHIKTQALLMGLPI